MEQYDAWPEWNNPRIQLFHGTLFEYAASIVQNGVDVSLGEFNTDFGRGFYTTTWRNQAAEWASVRGYETGKVPAILQLSIDRTALSQLDTLAFIRGSASATDYWSFVWHCRNRSSLATVHSVREYDLVYGPVARDWATPISCRVWSDFDQISFHGAKAQQLLRDSRSCEMRIV